MANLFLGFRWLAVRRPMACFAVGLLSIALRVALLPKMPVPVPGTNDGFSYRLAAVTFLNGRLPNPPHPFWEHFETFHVLQQPSYASKYPPFQGVVLAVGQLLGHPWIGVLLSAGVMCGVICWMLQGWIAAEWALLGALMAALRIGVASYWMNSYWGGAVAAIGGALVLGAAPRVAGERRVRDALMFAVGLSILMNSRPYEGTVLAMLTAAAAGCWLYSERAGWRVVATRVVLPVVLVVVAAVLSMAYENWRVTKDALLMPYVAHDRQYAVASLFLWSGTRPVPVYHHAVLRQYWAGWQVQVAKEARQDIAGEFFSRLGTLYGFYFGLWPVLAIALIWPFQLKTREERWTVYILAAFLVATVMPLAGILPHYSAPVMALLYLRLLQGFTRLSQWRQYGKPFGAVLVTGLLGAWMVQNGSYLRRSEPVAFARDRAQVIRQLEETPGQHLVLVRYGPNHSVHNEWVYNTADVDGSRIVWAREMGSKPDAPLLQYYRGRHVWTLEDDGPVQLKPYSQGAVATLARAGAAQ